MKIFTLSQKQEILKFYLLGWNGSQLSKHYNLPYFQIVEIVSTTPLPLQLAIQDTDNILQPIAAA